MIEQKLLVIAYNVFNIDILLQLTLLQFGWIISPAPVLQQA